MKEIVCPNCKTPFKVDETGFAEILKQVRDGQFEEDLNADNPNAPKPIEPICKNCLLASMIDD